MGMAGAGPSKPITKHQHLSQYIHDTDIDDFLYHKHNFTKSLQPEFEPTFTFFKFCKENELPF